MKKIEIIPWVKFNSPGVKKELEKLVKESESKMDFLAKVRTEYQLSLTDAKVVSDNFYKKEI